jgi:hypothetical protein
VNALTAIIFAIGYNSATNRRNAQNIIEELRKQNAGIKPANNWSAPQVNSKLERKK